MEVKLEDFVKYFEDSKDTSAAKLIDISNFVDDDRPTVTTFKKGTYFNEETKRLEESEEVREKHLEENKSGEQITAETILKMSNSLSPNLEFTIEKPSEFPEGWLPTLDFEMKFCKTDGKILYRYYQKPMKTKWVIPPYSAFDPNQLEQILANDLVRRLARICPSIRKTEETRVLNDYNSSLK